jgi:hypothetical protein
VRPGAGLQVELQVMMIVAWLQHSAGPGRLCGVQSERRTVAFIQSVSRCRSMHPDRSFMMLCMQERACHAARLPAQGSTRRPPDRFPDLHQFGSDSRSSFPGHTAPAMQNSAKMCLPVFTARSSMHSRCHSLILGPALHVRNGWSIAREQCNAAVDRGSPVHCCHVPAKPWQQPATAARRQQQSMTATAQ